MSSRSDDMSVLGPMCEVYGSVVSRQAMKVLLSLFCLSVTAIDMAASVAARTVPRPITDTDIITMTFLPSSRHQGRIRSRLDDGDEEVAQFSPDGKRFV